MARLERMAPDRAKDSTCRPGHGDRKALSRERAYKIAMGHKADDHEDGMTMA